MPVALTFAALLVAQAAVQPPPANAEIVVTGKAMSEAQAREQSLTFIRTAVAIPIGGQFARWNAPVCPRVFGIDAHYAAIVDAKVRTVANEAGVKLGKKGCNPNLLIGFTEDARGQMRAIVKKRPRLLNAMEPDQKLALTTAALPVRWWYSTRIEGRDGEQANSASAMFLGSVVEGGQSGLEVGESANVISSTRGTLIGTKVRATMIDAGVLIDLKEANGYPLEAVAAYAAMVSLVRVRMNSAVGPDTILGLFAKTPGGGPRDLTAQDRAFLSALYKVPVDRDARTQRGLILAEMTRTLTGR